MSSEFDPSHDHRNASPAARAELVRWVGHVQGVGFRATVEGIARRRGVHGWVRNRTDGSVEALLIGSSESVQAALDAVAAERARYVRSVTTRAVDRPTNWPPRFVIARTAAADEWPA